MLLTALALTVAAPACRTVDGGLPRPLAGWRRTASGLDTGHAVTLRAGRDKAVATTVAIRNAGTFGIALDQSGWIDVAPLRGRPLALIGEGKAPLCSTIRKIVRYRLRPGSYRVTVSRLSREQAKLMLVRY